MRGVALPSPLCGLLLTQYLQPGWLTQLLAACTRTRWLEPVAQSAHCSGAGWLTQLLAACRRARWLEPVAQSAHCSGAGWLTQLLAACRRARWLEPVAQSAHCSGADWLADTLVPPGSEKEVLQAQGIVPPA